MIGDSTVADMYGWGPAFGKRFSNKTKIVNFAKNGATLPSLSDKLDELLKLDPDYELIQFGHNDQKRYDLNAYSANLKSYVDRIKKAGGQPVIVSSVTRRTFDENGKIISQLVKSEKYTFKGNLTEYAQAAQTVANDLNLPFIDLHTRSIEHHNKIGREESMTYNFVQSDNTHFSKKGSEAITDLIIEEIKTAFPELSEYLK